MWRGPSRASLQWEPEADASVSPLLPPDSPFPAEPRAPPPRPCLAAVRKHPLTLPALALLFACALSLLAFFSAGFAAAYSTPSLQSATCASTTLDGPCAIPDADGSCELRCPPRCADAWVGSAEAYAVYGGGAAGYRGDSKLCRAALHAGLVSDASGGCVRVRVGAGLAAAYPAGAAPQHGVRALPGDFFPTSLALLPSRAPFCGSLQWPWLAALALLAAAAHALAPPAPAFALTSAAAFVYLTFTARGGDPYATLLQGFACALSAAALLRCVYAVSVRHALEAPPHGALGRRAAFHLLPLLTAMHMNLFTAFLPDFSFSAASLSALPASGIALVCGLCVVLLGGTAYQARLLHASGMGRGYACAYLAGAAALGLLSLLLRAHAAVHVHHSILALALLPLTRFPTAPSMALQAVLLGMLLNGLALWGVAGPWDALVGGLPAPPGGNCTVAGGLGQGGLWLNWSTCSAPPPGARYALSLNGAQLYQGAAQSLQVGVPQGANLSVALFYVFADGTLSLPTPPAVF